MLRLIGIELELSQNNKSSGIKEGAPGDERRCLVTCALPGSRYKCISPVLRDRTRIDARLDFYPRAGVVPEADRKQLLAFTSRCHRAAHPAITRKYQRNDVLPGSDLEDGEQPEG